MRRIETDRLNHLPFEQLDDRSDLPHVGDGQFFDRESVLGVEFLGPLLVLKSNSLSVCRDSTIQ